MATLFIYTRYMFSLQWKQNSSNLMAHFYKVGMVEGLVNKCCSYVRLGEAVPLSIISSVPQLSLFSCLWNKQHRGK